MSPLAWILLGGVAMTAVALVGGLALLLGEGALDRLLLPLVAFAAGSLIGGAFFHMLPAALLTSDPLAALAWAAAGFTLFFAIEQFLHAHHGHRAAAAGRRPLTYLILIGDGLHNFLGGLAVGGVFLVDIRLGIAAWLAAAAHEVPQELGDFGVLVHGGWEKGKALLLNVISASTFLVGGLLAYAASRQIEVGFLVPFAAGNFLYIGAADLVPKVQGEHGGRQGLEVMGWFLAGLGLLYLLAVRLG